MPTNNWESLLAEARGGSAAALGQLLDGFRPYLWVIARNEIGLPLQAKVGGSDLVQESLLKAYRRFARFEGCSRAELESWLVRILRNVIAHQRRRYRAERRHVGREVSMEGGSSVRRRNELAGPGETPSQAASSRETRQAVRRAIAQLPPHYQEVIRLRSEERRAFEEVGRIIGRTPDGTRMLWGRAVRKLQSLLDEPP